jgi:hypothetical protein
MALIVFCPGEAMRQHVIVQCPSYWLGKRCQIRIDYAGQRAQAEALIVRCASAVIHRQFCRRRNSLKMPDIGSSLSPGLRSVTMLSAIAIRLIAGS